MIQTELVEIYMEQKSTCWLHEPKTEHQPYESLYSTACKQVINSVIWVPLTSTLKPHKLLHFLDCKLVVLILNASDSSYFFSLCQRVVSLVLSS